MRQFLRSPPTPLIDYQHESAAHHLNICNLKGFQYILTNNRKNHVDFIELITKTGQPDFSIQIDQMQCSFETPTFLFIGSQTRLYCISKETAQILSHVKV